MLTIKYSHGLGLVKTTLEAQNFFFMVEHLASENIQLDCEAGRQLIEANTMTEAVKVQDMSGQSRDVIINGLELYTINFFQNEDIATVSKLTLAKDSYMFMRLFEEARLEFETNELIERDYRALRGSLDSFKRDYSRLIGNYGMLDVMSDIDRRITHEKANGWEGMGEHLELLELRNFLAMYICDGGELLAQMKLQLNQKYSETDASGFGVDTLRIVDNEVRIGGKLICKAYINKDGEAVNEWLNGTTIDDFTKPTQKRVMGLISLMLATMEAK